MVANIQEFEELTQKLSQQAEHLAGVPKGERVDICTYWRIAKPVVETVIAILEKLPFKWAKDAAAVLKALDNTLSAFCPA